MSMVSESFDQRVDDTMIRIEELVEELELDIDAESGQGILTLTIENNRTQIIVTRQAAAEQLWLAARQGGYHFDYDKSQGEWVCDKSGLTLSEKLSEAVSDQLGEPVTMRLVD